MQYLNKNSNQHEQSSELYSHLPVTLFQADDVRELDRFAIEECGVDGFELMNRAARFAFHMLLKNWPACETLVVLCGSGNNAGDGYLMAALAKKRGIDAIVFFASHPDKLQGDAKRAYLNCLQHQVPCREFDATFFTVSAAKQQTIIVDALLGTGLNAPVRGIYRQMIEAANQQLCPILAVDIPSGLCSNTGQALGIAIQASATATFIGLKLGLFTGHGREYAGKLYFSQLDLDDQILQHRQATAFRLDLNKLLAQINPRPRSTHKGQCGHVMIIGGSTGFGGAAIMASIAAARMGAGLTSVITEKINQHSILFHQPEVMSHSPESKADIDLLLGKADVIVIGPGLGLTAWSEKVLLTALDSLKPLVMDADALNLISSHAHLQNRMLAQDKSIKSNYVLTPHPGEAGRLLGRSSNDIQSDRLASLKELQHKWGGHILLKGNGSLIISDSSEVSLCPYGNPGMASGGMGDVLSGFIGGLIAQGFETRFALKLAVTIHAFAADIAAADCGERGLLATDLIPIARHLLNSCGRD